MPIFRTLLRILILLLIGGSAHGDGSPTPLRIALYNEAPFAYTSNGEVRGLMVEIWADIASELDLEYQYTLTEMNSLIDGLVTDQYDVGLGAITITPQREQLVDFSQPVNASGTGIILSKAKSGAGFASYVWPITLAIIILAASLALLLVVSGTLVWFVERRHPRDPGHRDIDTIEDGLWWSAVTVSTIGYGDKVPRTRVGRIIGVIWIFTGLVMLSLFTANASAIFTMAEIESQIESKEDLRKVLVGAAAGSSGEEYLKRERIGYREYANIKLALDSLLEGEIDAVVSNVPVVRYLNNTHYKGQLTIASPLLLENNMGIALPTDSELQDDINVVLLRLITEPKWRNSLERYLGSG